MTDQEINIIIDKACGWTFEEFNVRDPEGHRLSYVCGLGRDKERYNVENAAEAIKRGLIPDYCNDLNAMHEAWETLTRAQKIEAADYLINITHAVREYLRLDSLPDLVWSQRLSSISDVIDATARQRAEAFLRTLNLWKE